MKPDNTSKPIPVNGISHGWIRPVMHPELGVEMNGQSVVRYLRFGHEVHVDRLELKPLVTGRWIPSVPTHPAHVTVSALDPASGNWRMLKDVELPSDPRISGEGLHQSMPIAEMDARLQAGLDVTHVIDLGGVATDLLRVECDREHPVWPNHGECNGTPYSVPFGTLDTLAAFGKSPDSESPLPGYLPPLDAGKIHAVAPDGMQVEVQPWLVLFQGERFSIGFSLVRPEILHLGWDGTGSRRGGENRISSRGQAFSGLFTGQSGPLLRTARGDYGSNVWTGRVEVEGNQIRYRDLHCGQGVTIDAVFNVSNDGFRLELTQRADRDIPVIEIETWRLAWDCAVAMTGAAAVPVLRPGRNGDVELPMFWAGDGNGALRCEKLDGEAYLQVEAYRVLNRVTGGLVNGRRPDPEECHIVPAGTTTSKWLFSVAAFEPVHSIDQPLPAAVRQHWGSLYCCYRPEYGGFSNNAISVNCHVNQHCPNETVAFTQQPERGPDPLAFYRFTIERALLGGGGYGFWRNLYLDSDPILVSGAGRIHQVRNDISSLRRIEPGLASAIERMLGTIGTEGLVVCHDLSGNSGSYRWSSNAMDVVGFGHMDAYVNAWTYRGLRNAVALCKALGRNEQADRSLTAAERLRKAYPEFLLNPETGWIAGWRSRDGKLHDMAYLWVNAIACAFGLLPRDVATEALRRLERLRHQVGAGRAHFGVPFNLWPISAEDHMLPLIHGRFTPTFENYTDGAMGACAAPYYLRALDIYGLKDEAAQIIADLEVGFERGHFNGGVGSGVEFYRWDGVPTGYEGSFVANWMVLYAIAIHHGLFQPMEPEWWPE